MRLVSEPIVGSGTPEAMWESWELLQGLPALELDCAAALVVAPHPDDEVLGAGGTLVELRTRGSLISVLALTDGEASHPNATVEPSELGRLRVAETRYAILELLDSCPIDRLELPDGRLAHHEEAICAELVARLGVGTWCIAPLLRDGHPDHEAAARAAAHACQISGARLVEYPIWMWHWSVPGDPRVPWSRARRVPLNPDARRRKQRAIGAFTSQIAPLSDDRGSEAILPPEILERFRRPTEVLFV
jgi:LmbE family N-acetylglucosaminyl deacetylase